MEGGGADPPVRVAVSQPATGREFPALVRRRRDHHELLPVDGGALPELLPGEWLVLRRPVADDALYEQPVLITAAPPATATVVVAADGEPQRRQQRDHVRVPVSRLDMALDPLDPPDVPADPAAVSARLVDLSAGGARVAHPGPALPAGSLWRARTVLDGPDGTPVPLDQSAEVRWSAAGGDDDADGHDDAVTGLRFLGVSARDERGVTRWVFREQSKWLRVRREQRQRSA